MQIRQYSTSLAIQGIDVETQYAILEKLKGFFNFEYEMPKYPLWDSWSPKIPLTSSARKVFNYKRYTRSGCYKIWMNDEIIYIGETRCGIEIVNGKRSAGRPGMWARRADFRSTILGKNIQNPYGNATRFVELFGTDISNVYHTFHDVHPVYCKDAELELLRDYYKIHGKLPVLQSDMDYKRVLNDTRSQS